MHYEFTAFPRGVEGRGASRRLRRSGRAPGIVYGGAAKPQPNRTLCKKFVLFHIFLWLTCISHNIRREAGTAAKVT